MWFIIKVFIILFLLFLWKQGTSWQFSKQISKLSLQLAVQVYSLLAQTEDETKIFFGECKEGGRIVRLSPRALGCHKNEKVCPIVKFEIIIPLLCCLLDPLSNKHCRAWSSMTNFWIDFGTCQKYRILLSAGQRSNNCLELSKENVFGNMMQICQH